MTVGQEPESLNLVELKKRLEERINPNTHVSTDRLQFIVDPKLESNHINLLAYNDTYKSPVDHGWEVVATVRKVNEFRLTPDYAYLEGFNDVFDPIRLVLFNKRNPARNLALIDLTDEEALEESEDD